MLTSKKRFFLLLLVSSFLGGVGEGASSLENADRLSILPDFLPEVVSTPLDDKTPATLPDDADKMGSGGEPASAKNTEQSFILKKIHIDAPDLYIEPSELTSLIADIAGKKITLDDVRTRLDRLTIYCRQRGYVAAAAFLPIQETKYGDVVIKIIPGRYGKVKIDNHSHLKEDIARQFASSLKEGKIIKTGELESILYSLSELTSMRAVGVLSKGANFGESDVTIRLEDGKKNSTILYSENYGSTASGRYRHGLQHSEYNLAGTGAKLNIGTTISSKDTQNYYVNYEAFLPRTQNTLGIGYSKMNYTIGGSLRPLDANGTANTLSLFGKKTIFHHTQDKLALTYGYDWRTLEDNLDAFNLKGKKHSHSAHVGLRGMDRVQDLIFDYDLNFTLGKLFLDSLYTEQLDRLHETAGTYHKLAGDVTIEKPLGTRTKFALKLSGQLASKNLDGSEEMYLGGADGVRAYRQGTGSGDRGLLGRLDIFYYLKDPRFNLRTFYDLGRVDFNKTKKDGDITLSGYGIGLDFNNPGDFFYRLDYARRIGLSDRLTNPPKDRFWFMLGKIW